MNSKQTDYINAQFENAALRIEDLFGEISKHDTAGSENKIACNYTHMRAGWFGDSCLLSLYIWKEKSRIHMVCNVVVWDSRTGWGITTDTINVEPWGIPNQSFRADSSGGGYMTLTPESSGVVISAHRGENSPEQTFTISTSWEA